MMAFKKASSAKKMVELVSMVDLVLILVVFFLVIRGASTNDETREIPIAIPTPKTTPGRAQIFIQIYGHGEYLWIDKEKIEEIIDHMRLFSQQPPEVESAYILSKAQCEHSYDKIGIKNQLAGLDFNNSYFLLIRCPDDAAYASVIHIISILGQAGPNVKYGLLGGDVSSLKIRLVNNDVHIDF